MTTALPAPADPIVLDRHAQDLLFRQARTANAFTDEPVDDDHVRAIYELVKWAPTAFNQQPLRIVLVRSAEARARLVEHMSGSNKAKTAAAPLVAVLAADTSFHRHLPSQFPVFPQAKDAFFADRTVREESARLNAALQVAYFIVGVRAAGLAAGPMSGFDPDGVARAFFPEGDHLPLVVVNIGRPAPGAWWGRLPRLEFDEVVRTT